MDQGIAPDIMPKWRGGTLVRPDCRIHYEVAGPDPGDGPAIVFAHGLGGNHMSWWQQMAHFSRNYTCVSFAHRGFMPSSPLPGGPDPAAYGADLGALVDELGLTDVRVVAQSMGGWTAVEYALTGPEALRGVVLAATTGSVDPRRLPEADHPALDAWTTKSALVRAEMARRGVHQAAGLRMAVEQPALALLYRQIDGLNAALDKEALRARMMAGRVRTPYELGAIECPVLMIGNDEDSVMPPMAADAIAAMIPNVASARIARAGHSAYFERPSEFNALLDAFFAKL